MSIKVLKPGLATSVQDAGREGHYHLGIPPSGALDQYALRAANLLVGNAPTAAVLECALLGPQLEFQRDALVAVCGARMTPRLEGAEMPLDTSFRVRAGQVLGFDFIRAGARGYLAIDGGIAVPEVLGSRSTYGLGRSVACRDDGWRRATCCPWGLPRPLPWRAWRCRVRCRWRSAAR
ncbi:hypothetical protein Q047_05323 [Pseudomonas aeruginosa BWHPSA042]|nr:hypothetical protein Q047_05323 [Pseudomonas aeruginosa BWHPSA042]